MSTLKTTNLQHASAASPAIVLDANSRATLNGLSYPTEGSLSGRNRIINGDMRIDQRNAGASVTPTAAVYGIDRWRMSTPVASKYSLQQNAGSVTPPAGFTNYLGVTSLSAYTVGAAEPFVAHQYIEGYNTADLAWGTASAKPITLSFWVRSSLTGTFGGALGNLNASRSYPFTYTISVANTWEYKTITVLGDTTGSWGTTNGIGIAVYMSFGTGSTYSGTAGAWAGAEYYSVTGATSVVGTNGATWYITGVQLEAGSVATPFERRSYGQELALCQRYFEKSYNVDVAVATNTQVGIYWAQGTSDNGSNTGATIKFSVPKRATPTMAFYSETGTSGSWTYSRNGASGTVALTNYATGQNSAAPYMNVGATWAACYVTGHWTSSAEL